jgi:hypothetical protein
MAEEDFRFIRNRYENLKAPKVVEYLLLRQHVSALALGHHQVSHCLSEDTIQSSMHVVRIIQRDLVDNMIIANCQKMLS